VVLSGMRLLFVISIILFFQKLIAQPNDGAIIKDLKPDWKIISNSGYKQYDQTKYVGTIYFLVDANLYGGSSLWIESEKDFSVFIGGKLISTRDKGVLFYDIDSLASLYSTPLEVSIRRLNVEITTKLVLNNAKTESADLITRKGAYFLDFSIITSVFLLVFFVVLLRTNPKLTLDYLNFARLFSVQEHEENVMALRITSSVNLLYYTFASLLSGLQLMVIFQFASPEISLANIFHANSLSESFYQWLWLSTIIVCLLFAKLVLIVAISYLYRSTEIAALQFFNFIRLFFFTFGILAILLIFLFMNKVIDPIWYFNLLYLAAGIFIFWEIMIFLKLMARLPFDIFHLFFYLCASELIPLVILLKVVFY
jgi:hypothetical protein